MTHTANTATEFVTSFTNLTSAAIIDQLTSIGSTQNEVRDTIGGLFYGVTLLPENEKEETLHTFLAWSVDTFGVNCDVVGAFISRFSQDTVKYVKKDRVLKRKKADTEFRFKCTPLQAMNWYAEVKSTAAQVTITWDADRIDSRIDKIVKQATEAGADNALIINRLRVAIASLDTEAPDPVKIAS